MNRKIAFIFPGQGTQYIGMAKELYDNFNIVKNTFNEAEDLTNLPLSKMMFYGPEDLLKDTLNQQPIIHTFEIALIKLIKELGINPDITAGFSLGEYASLVLANVLEFKDSIKLVAKRGEFMQKASLNNKGTMLLVKGLNVEEIFNYLDDIKEIGYINISNYNSPKQNIVAGEVEAVKEFERKIKNKNISYKYLKVSGPFHTILIKEAGNMLYNELKGISINKKKLDYIPNVTAKLHKDEDIKLLLKEHVYKPVLWTDSLYEMKKQGINTFIELGPSGGLTKLVKETLEDVDLYKMEDLNDYKQIGRMIK